MQLARKDMLEEIRCHSLQRNKELSKEIMTRSRLRNKYIKNRNEENRVIYVKQRNYCVSLLRKSKKKYYENLDENFMDLHFPIRL